MFLFRYFTNNTYYFRCKRLLRWWSWRKDYYHYYFAHDWNIFSLMTPTFPLSVPVHSYERQPWKLGDYFQFLEPKYLRSLHWDTEGILKTRERIHFIFSHTNNDKICFGLTIASSTTSLLQPLYTLAERKTEKYVVKKPQSIHFSFPFPFAFPRSSEQPVPVCLRSGKNFPWELNISFVLSCFCWLGDRTKEKGGPNLSKLPTRELTFTTDHNSTLCRSGNEVGESSLSYEHYERGNATLWSRYTCI